MLRAAATGGVGVSHELLAAVTRLDDAALAASRSAVDANVMVADADGYAFRHDLIRQAVREDLLPGEAPGPSGRSPKRWKPTPRWTSTAWSRFGLRCTGAARTSLSERCARPGRGRRPRSNRFAVAEQLQMLEQVLRAVGPGANTPRHRPDRGDRAGHDAACGPAERGWTLVEAALGELGEAGGTSCSAGVSAAAARGAPPAGAAARAGRRPDRAATGQQPGPGALRSSASSAGPCGSGAATRKRNGPPRS